MSMRVFIPLFLLLLACGSTTMPTNSNLPAYQEIVCTSNIANFLAQPSDRYILRMVRLDKQKTTAINLFLMSPKNQGIDLGRIIRPQANAPLFWMTFETGSTRFIAGWIDSSVSGKPTYITFASPNSQRDKAVRVAERCFVMPISEREFDEWLEISKISIQTEESLQNGVDNFNASGNAWESQWLTPLNITDQFMYIP